MGGHQHEADDLAGDAAVEEIPHGEEVAEGLRHLLAFDIHGGGIDLVFPHHENEIAQSMCAHPDADFARFWMHNGFLNVEGEKMSKSLGNFFTVRDLLDQGIPSEVIRFVLMSTHYRQPMDFTERKAEEAEKTLRRWEQLLIERPGARSSPALQYHGFAPAVLAALADDLNTPKAISELHALYEEAKGVELVESNRALTQLQVSASLLGLNLDIAESAARRKGIAETLEGIDAIQTLIERRAEAKRARDFATADHIRDSLLKAGVLLKDHAGGTNWERTREFDASRLEALR